MQLAARRSIGVRLADKLLVRALRLQGNTEQISDHCAVSKQGTG